MAYLYELKKLISSFIENITASLLPRGHQINYSDYRKSWSNWIFANIYVNTQIYYDNPLQLSPFLLSIKFNNFKNLPKNEYRVHTDCENNQCYKCTRPLEVRPLDIIKNYDIGGIILPKYLRTLAISGKPYNRDIMSVIPDLPQNLTKLEIEYIKIYKIPVLPESLTILKLYNICTEKNQHRYPLDISNIVLPHNLKEFVITGCQITGLCKLNPNLKILICNNNYLSKLPELPDTLNELSCEYNQITELPKLPANLYYLYCYENLLTRIPELPDKLAVLHCGNQSLEYVPDLPNSMRSVIITSHVLTILPILPNRLVSIQIRAPISKRYLPHQCTRRTGSILSRCDVCTKIRFCSFNSFNSFIVNNISYSIKYYKSNSDIILISPIYWLLYPIKTAYNLYLLEKINATTRHLRNMQAIKHEITEAYIKKCLHPARISKLIDAGVLDFESAENWDELC